MNNNLSNKIIFDALNTNDDRIDIDTYLKQMRQAYMYQSYLTGSNFQLFCQFQKIVQELKKNDFNTLNTLQQKFVKYYDEQIVTTKIIQDFSPTINDNDGGVSYKYTNPNGFISIMLVLCGTLCAGVMIAALIMCL